MSSILIQDLPPLHLDSLNSFPCSQISHPYLQEPTASRYHHQRKHPPRQDILLYHLPRCHLPILDTPPHHQMPLHRIHATLPRPNRHLMAKLTLDMCRNRTRICTALPHSLLHLVHLVRWRSTLPPNSKTRHPRTTTLLLIMLHNQQTVYLVLRSKARLATSVNSRKRMQD